MSLTAWDAWKKRGVDFYEWKKNKKSEEDEEEEGVGIEASFELLCGCDVAVYIMMDKKSISILLTAVHSKGTFITDSILIIIEMNRHLRVVLLSVISYGGKRIMNCFTNNAEDCCTTPNILSWRFKYQMKHLISEVIYEYESKILIPSRNCSSWN